jgi:hypothetical protein
MGANYNFQTQLCNTKNKKFCLPQKYAEAIEQKTIPENGLIHYFWCPRTESNRYLMITNQLHDLHATGAKCIGTEL